MTQAEVVNLLGAFLQFLIWGGIFALVVTLSILNRDAFGRHFKSGLIVGLICFALVVPNTIFSAFFLDPGELMGQGPGEAGREFVELGLRIGMVIGFFVLVLRVGWHMLEYYVAAAEWGRFKPDPFPILQGRENRRMRTVLAAAALGVAAGALSLVALQALGVQVSDAVKDIQRLFPRAANAPLAVRLPVFLCAFSGLAVVEELAFRGVLLGWLLRVGRPRGGYAVCAIVLVSLLWALLHIPNTNAPLLKCGQIFVFGLLLGELARRWSVEAAIAAHVALNLSVVILGLTLYGVHG